MRPEIQDHHRFTERSLIPLLPETDYFTCVGDYSKKFLDGYHVKSDCMTLTNLQEPPRLSLELQKIPLFHVEWLTASF